MSTSVLSGDQRSVGAGLTTRSSEQAGRWGLFCCSALVFALPVAELESVRRPASSARLPHRLAPSFRIMQTDAFERSLTTRSSEQRLAGELFCIPRLAWPASVAELGFVRALRLRFFAGFGAVRAGIGRARAGIGGSSASFPAASARFSRSSAGFLGVRARFPRSRASIFGGRASFLRGCLIMPVSPGFCAFHTRSNFRSQRESCADAGWKIRSSRTF